MKKITMILIATVLLSACAPAPTKSLAILTHSSFSVSEEVINSFETDNNVKVAFIQGGDAGEMLNKAILTKKAPLADVLFGVDNTFLSRALEEGIFQAYTSPMLVDIPQDFILDGTHQATPVDFGDVCINYDKQYFLENHLEVPNSLEMLTQPEYENLLVVQNPGTSSTGLAFLLATRAHFGDGYLKYWESLKENGVVVVDGWETAYYTNFSGSSGRGPQPLVVSYATSPAAEVVFAETPLDDSPTGAITDFETCFRQVEFAGILKGTQNLPLAEKFIDFLLSVEFQEDMPLQMFVHPVNRNAAVPEEFVKYTQTPESPATIPPQEIAANRDAWIEAWTRMMK